MMYDPDHHCQVPGFDANDTTSYLWGLDEVQELSMVFPSVGGSNGYERDRVRGTSFYSNYMFSVTTTRGHRIDTRSCG